MKILLTGAKGQLGHALQQTLASHAVTALDHLQLDITKLTDVRSAIYALYPDVVINAAASAHVSRNSS